MNNLKGLNKKYGQGTWNEEICDYNMGTTKIINMILGDEEE